MKAGEIFSKTMPFVLAKLLLGVITVIVSAVLLAMMMGIAYVTQNWFFTLVLLGIWFGLNRLVNTIIMRYFGYLIKAGHIAVITEAVTTGYVPDNQVNYGIQKVKDRFLTSNIYFVVDGLVSAAVKQIQRGIGTIGNLLDFIPGLGTLTNLAQKFVELSLGYVDECCLGFTFYNKEQSACKSAADGVVIYAQNWKTLLGSAAKTMLMISVATVIITIVIFSVVGIIFSALEWSQLIAFIISALLALAIKGSFIDSFILTRTMVAYMQVAPSTVITFDLYGKLCGISAKFKELFNKGQQEQPMPQASFAQSGTYGGGF